MCATTTPWFSQTHFYEHLSLSQVALSQYHQPKRQEDRKQSKVSSKTGKTGVMINLRSLDRCSPRSPQLKRMQELLFLLELDAVISQQKSLSLQDRQIYLHLILKDYLNGITRGCERRLKTQTRAGNSESPRNTQCNCFRNSCKVLQCNR